MNYKVVPFSASTSRKGSSSDIADQLQDMIDVHAQQGWAYFRMENVETYIQPSGGCFGIGGQPGYSTSIQVLVFKQQGE